MDYRSIKVISLKYTSLSFILLIIFNYIFNIHKIIVKIPLISSIYSISFILIILFQTYSFNNIIYRLDNKGLNCLNTFPFKFRINNFYVKYKYKVSLTYIFLTYISIIYL